MWQYITDIKVMNMNKIDLSTPAQKWRLASFCTSLSALILMAVPGSLIMGKEPVSYIWNFGSWFNPVSFALVAIAAFSAAWALVKEENRLLDNLFANGLALFLLILSGSFYDVTFYQEEGNAVWLPYLPPVLILLSTAAVVIAALVSWYDPPAKKQEKKPLFSPAQIWRLTATLFGVAAAVTTAVPGTVVFRFIDSDYVQTSYLYLNIYSGYLPNLGYLLVIFTVIYLFLGFIKRKNSTVALLLCDAPVLFIMYFFELRFAFQAMTEGYFFWLPFVPPVLLALSMLTAVVAWFVGWKEA